MAYNNTSDTARLKSCTVRTSDLGPRVRRVRRRRVHIHSVSKMYQSNLHTI